MDITAAFISGEVELYSELRDNPRLYHVPIERLDSIRRGLKRLGYSFRVRYRGPRIGTDNRHTLKRHARAFTVYITR